MTHAQRRPPPPQVPRNYYTYDYGMCYYGHAPNGYGRCIYIEEQGGCPPPYATQREFLLGLTRERQEFTANSLSIPYTATISSEDLVDLMMAVYFPNGA